MSDKDRNVPYKQLFGFVNHILTLIFIFFKVEEPDSPEQYRQHTIDIITPSHASTTSIAPIPDATTPCHSPSTPLRRTTKIGNFFGIFELYPSDHVMGMAYGRNRRFIHNITIIFKQIRLKHKSKTLS